jgi:uncharacterized protein YdeI (YjbR/CyaY-like superfamily)
MSKFIGKGELEIIAFADKESMYDWMLANHAEYPGIWVRIYKKASGVPSVVWAEVVDVCLCFGWIDGVANAYDEISYLQRLTPRRKRSVWSKINRRNVERLIEERRMHTSGQAQIDAAKADGRWDMAYDSPKDMKVPADFSDALKRHPKAMEAYANLKKSQLYSIAHSVSTAKRPDTRERRIAAFIDKLERGDTI